MTENIPIFDGVTGILIHTSVKLVTYCQLDFSVDAVILIHTSVKLVTYCQLDFSVDAVILIHTSVKLVTLAFANLSSTVIF